MTDETYVPPTDDRSTPASRAPRDAGMSIVEVMVALVLFALLSTAVISAINTAQRLTYEDGARVDATNLAVRELEITRDVFFGATRGPERVRINRVVNANPLPGGAVNQPLQVDGTDFTVVREAQWASNDPVESACDEGTSAELTMLRVDVEVSWPDLGDRPPVRMSTLMTPPKGTYSAITGHLGLRVIDRNGAPVVGATVAARSSAGALRTGDTASDGCVILGFLEAGTWTVTLSQSGKVNPAGDRQATTTANIVAGQVWRGTVEYDLSASIDATFTAKEGWALPTGISSIPVSLGNSAILPAGARAISGTGSTRALRDLWPYASGYELWAGNCVDNDPGAFRTNPVDASPGGPVTSASVALAPLTVRAPASSTVYAQHASDSSCSSAVTVVLGTTGSSDTLKTSLPYGKWTIVRTTGSGSNQTSKNGTVTYAAPDPETTDGFAPPQTVDLR